MAQKVTVLLEDDLDGKPADKTHYIGLDGQWHAIDLSKTNGKALDTALSKFLAVARKVQPDDVPGLARSRRSGNGVVMRPAAQRKRMAAIRTWAIGEGMEVSNRGRIPASVVAKYDAAH